MHAVQEVPSIEAMRDDPWNGTPLHLSLEVPAAPSKPGCSA